MIKRLILLTAACVATTPITSMPEFNDKAYEDIVKMPHLQKRLYLTWDAILSGLIGATTGYGYIKAITILKECGYNNYMATAFTWLTEYIIRSSCMNLVQELESEKYTNPEDVNLSNRVTWTCAKTASWLVWAKSNGLL